MTDEAQVANTARLYALIARARRRAVVFRREPSKQVRLLVWELGSDTIVGGLWLKGRRIYERRCLGRFEEATEALVADKRLVTLREFALGTGDQFGASLGPSLPPRRDRSRSAAR